MLITLLAPQTKSGLSGKAPVFAAEGQVRKSTPLDTLRHTFRVSAAHRGREKCTIRRRDFPTRIYVMSDVSRPRSNKTYYISKQTHTPYCPLFGEPSFPSQCHTGTRHSLVWFGYFFFPVPVPCSFCGPPLFSFSF